MEPPKVYYVWSVRGRKYHLAAGVGKRTACGLAVLVPADLGHWVGGYTPPPKPFCKNCQAMQQDQPA